MPLGRHPEPEFRGSQPELHQVRPIEGRSQQQPYGPQPCHEDIGSRSLRP